MTDLSATFDMPGLGRALDTMDEDALGALAFGTILIGSDGTVHRYSTREATLSGFAKTVIGRNWLTDIAPCMATDFFQAMLRDAAENRVLDVIMDTTGDFLDPGCAIHLRLVSSPRTGHVWMALERPGRNAAQDQRAGP